MVGKKKIEEIKWEDKKENKEKKIFFDIARFDRKWEKRKWEENDFILLSWVEKWKKRKLI